MSEFAEVEEVGGSFLPEDEEPLDPLEELDLAEEELEGFPLEEELELEEEEARPPLGRGWALDPAARGFVTGETGKGPLPTHGLATLRTWIAKCLNTARGAHPIYSDDFGIEDPFAEIGMPASHAGAGYEERVREALIFHPRITDIDDFVAERDGDALLCSFSVVLDDDTVLPVDALRIGV